MVCAQARILLEDPTAEEHILQHWEILLPEALQKWQLRPDLLSAFSDGYRNASLMKDRVGPSACGSAAVIKAHRPVVRRAWAYDPLSCPEAMHHAVTSPRQPSRV